MLRRGEQGGFSLLEAMIAIVVVALGVLGVLGVQLRTLAETQTSVRRAQAIRLIEDLAERIRANPNALSPAVLNRYALGWGAVTGTVPNCSSACSAADLARSEVVQWKQNVTGTLPLSDANVFLVAPAAGTNGRTQLGVMVSWRENERAGADAAENAAYRAPFVLSAPGVACPADSICHLQYLQPTLRCTPWIAANASAPQAICP